MQAFCLHDVVGFAVVLVELVVAIGKGAVVAVLIALAADDFGRIERRAVAVGNVGADVFLIVGVGAGAFAHDSYLSQGLQHLNRRSDFGFGAAAASRCTDGAGAGEGVAVDRLRGCLVYLAHAKALKGKRKHMSVNVVEYFNKLQEEGLKTLKQSQDASLAAFNEFRSFSKELQEKPGTIPSIENLPTPTQLVELSFNFASQVLELRKAYTLKIAEMLVETQKQAEATVKAATQNVQQNGQQNVQPTVRSAK